MDHPIAEETIEPHADSLVESLRDFGYTLESALADVVDNSITAAANIISIQIDSGAQPYIAVIDNGSGMSEERLVAAMRMGVEGPGSGRDAGDLGRFGLGLKTASLSQGRKVSVITKISGRTASVRCWDIEHIKKTKLWQLTSDLSDVGSRLLSDLEAQVQGTVVLIENLDRVNFVNSGTNDAHLGRSIETVRQHLGMVFHRFLDEGVKITLGRNLIKPWNPFVTALSTRLPEETIHLGDAQITVAPYILPHHSKFGSEEDHMAAGGPKGWTAHQGFYIYRAKRLIVPGTWLNLNLRNEMHYNLARIRVDIPNSLDHSWHLNVMKSHVAAPAVLKADFQRIAQEVRRRATDVYRFRGERQVPSTKSKVRYLWKREVSRSGVRYRIDHEHPAVEALVDSRCEHKRALKELISLIENTIPISSMLQEPQKTLEGSAEKSMPDLEELRAMAIHAINFYISKGQSPAQARSTVLSADPFVRYGSELETSI